MRMTTITTMIHFRRDDARGAGETGGSETGTGDADMGPCAKVPPPDESRPMPFPYSKVLAHRPEGPALSYQSGHQGKGFNVAYPCGSPCRRRSASRPARKGPRRRRTTRDARNERRRSGESLIKTSARPAGRRRRKTQADVAAPGSRSAKPSHGEKGAAGSVASRRT